MNLIWCGWVGETMNVWCCASLESVLKWRNEVFFSVLMCTTCTDFFTSSEFHLNEVDMKLHFTHGLINFWMESWTHISELILAFYLCIWSIAKLTIKFERHWVKLQTNANETEVKTNLFLKFFTKKKIHVPEVGENDNSVHFLDFHLLSTSANLQQLFGVAMVTLFDLLPRRYFTIIINLKVMRYVFTRFFKYWYLEYSYFKLV